MMPCRFAQDFVLAFGKPDIVLSKTGERGNRFAFRGIFGSVAIRKNVRNTLQKPRKNVRNNT